MFQVKANVASKQEAEKVCIELLRKGYTVSLTKSENGKKEEEATKAVKVAKPARKARKVKAAEATTDNKEGSKNDTDN